MGLSVLLIDDSPSDATMFQLVARDSTAVREIVHFSDGAEALEFLQRDPNAVNVVVLDLHMPGMSGREVLTAIRDSESTSDLPVILTSAGSSLAEEEQVGPLPEAQFIDKSEGLDGCRAVLSAIEELESKTASSNGAGA